VISAENHAGYGRGVVVITGSGSLPWYAHLSSFSTITGSRIKRGQVIGYCGISGRSTDRTCTMKLRMNNAPVNPWRYMKSTPAGD